MVLYAKRISHSSRRKTRREKKNGNKNKNHVQEYKYMEARSSVKAPVEESSATLAWAKSLRSNYWEKPRPTLYLCLGYHHHHQHLLV